MPDRLRWYIGDYGRSFSREPRKVLRYRSYPSWRVGADFTIISGTVVKTAGVFAEWANEHELGFADCRRMINMAMLVDSNKPERSIDSILMANFLRRYRTKEQFDDLLIMLELTT